MTPAPETAPLQVVVISDTHGLLRPEVLAAVAGADRILHAGDVGDPKILRQLEEHAPVDVVAGNVDTAGPLGRLPSVVSGQLGELSFHMVHRREDVAPAWTRESRLIVFGHSHRPELEWRGRCLLLNPGAVGPRRFTLPLTFARLRIEGQRLLPEIVAIG